MNAREFLAWNVRRLRAEQNIPQERLALDASVDRSYVGRVERRLENPSIGVVEKLAATLGVPITALFAEPAEGEAVPKTLRAGRTSKA